MVQALLCRRACDMVISCRTPAGFLRLTTDWLPSRSRTRTRSKKQRRHMLAIVTIQSRSRPARQILSPREPCNTCDLTANKSNSRKYIPHGIPHKPRTVRNRLLRSLHRLRCCTPASSRALGVVGGVIICFVSGGRLEVCRACPEGGVAVAILVSAIRRSQTIR